MVGYWISFVAIIFAILIGIPLLKAWIFKNTKKTITAEIEKKADIKVVLYILFYLLFDLFYMSCFIDNIVCKYIFGGLILVIIFMNLSKCASFPKERKVFESFSMIQDFIIGIALTVYLIYIIPNKEIQNIVIPTVSAVYGGLITLAGVALTIRKSDKDRREDEIKKAKPLVFVFDYSTMSLKRENVLQRALKSDTAWGSLKRAEGNQKSYKIPIIPINNVDYSHCSIVGFRINNEHHLFDVAQVLPKNSMMLLHSDFNFIFEDEIAYVALLIKDMLDNIYELEVSVTFEKNYQEKQIQIFSSLQMKKTDLKINLK